MRHYVDDIFDGKSRNEKQRLIILQIPHTCSGGSGKIVPRGGKQPGRGKRQT